ncbi:hypothetical protein [Streptomyces eurocidicus]|uniref:Uncharacterized protein n=1 Tax=Streptomyces eurocidicus TaxID=66423 RepID=A0A7W8B4G0_STREU|nr:hypothetical protein [Streptomyces eurocidicus]MBB5116616.1 hypothetical protein [Streptomyces eurocidicus]MBF6052382.1 hypothetical protein [Streptomyces eurocidicus]
MAFENEWDELRAESVARLEQDRAGAAESHTRLNGTGPASGNNGGDNSGLASSAAKKKAAVSALEQHVQPDTQKAGKVMDETTEAAAKGFKDWATGAGINEALKGWRVSVKALENRLAGEKAGLSGANTLFQGADKGLGGQFGLYGPPLLPPRLPGAGQTGGNAPFTSRLTNYN